LRQAGPTPLDPEVTPARGLLHRTTSFQHFELTRFEPSDDLREQVEHHWLILHDLGDRPPYTQQNLSHPSQHIVVDPKGQTGLFGAASGVFTHTLEGSGRVFGTKFRPGMFRPYFGRAVSALTDTCLPVETTFERSSDELAAEFSMLNDPLQMAERMEELVRRKAVLPDARALQARGIVEAIAATPAMTSAQAVADCFGVSTRTLQRLFDDYVGLSPKWVIDRYRMLEAVETLNAGAEAGLTELAHRLGYFDQAAFNHAFEKLTGKSPSFYRQPSL
jgi:AraC-like DNA-binding protein